MELSFLQLQNVVDINSDFFIDWNNFTAANTNGTLKPKTYDDLDGLGPQHVTRDMLTESDITPNDVTVGANNIEIEIPLVQKLMPYFVKRQLNLERKIHGVIQLSTELLLKHKRRIENKRVRIEKKRSVSNSMFHSVTLQTDNKLHIRRRQIYNHVWVQHSTYLVTVLEDAVQQTTTGPPGNWILGQLGAQAVPKVLESQMNLAL